MGLEGYLEERLAQIVTEREEVLVRLEQIRAKMERADAKRSDQDDTSNYKKWSSILRGLENDHDKHKAMITTLEAEAKEKTARFTQLRNDREQHQSKLEENYKRIMSLPPEEMAALTPEDMELLQEYELQMEAAERAAQTPEPEETPTEQNKYVQVTDFRSSKKEPDASVEAIADPLTRTDDSSVSITPTAPLNTQEAPQEPVCTAQVSAASEVTPTVSSEAVSAPTSTSPPSPPEGMDAKSRRKHAFQSALEKSNEGEISALTFEEVAVMLTVYRKLASQPSDNPDAAALEKNVSGAMWEVHAHCARICANWADIVLRDSASRKD